MNGETLLGKLNMCEYILICVKQSKHQIFISIGEGVIL